MNSHVNITRNRFSEEDIHGNLQSLTKKSKNTVILEYAENQNGNSNGIDKVN